MQERLNINPQKSLYSIFRKPGVICNKNIEKYHFLAYDIIQYSKNLSPSCRNMQVRRCKQQFLLGKG
jgi:hypothetical protein